MCIIQIYGFVVQQGWWRHDSCHSQALFIRFCCCFICIPHRRWKKLFTSAWRNLWSHYCNIICSIQYMTSQREQQGQHRTTINIATGKEYIQLSISRWLLAAAGHTVITWRNHPTSKKISLIQHENHLKPLTSTCTKTNSNDLGYWGITTHGSNDWESHDWG